MLESQVVLNYCLGFFYVTPITLRLLSTYYSFVYNLRASFTMFNENDFIIFLTLSFAGAFVFPRPTFYILFVG